MHTSRTALGTGQLELQVMAETERRDTTSTTKLGALHPIFRHRALHHLKTYTLAQDQSRAQPGRELWGPLEEEPHACLEEELV